MDKIGNVKLLTAFQNFQEDKDKRDLKEVCKEFEALFISYLLRCMRRTIPKSDILQDNASKEIYSYIMDEQVARTIANGPGIGLAEILFRQLKSIQGQLNATNETPKSSKVEDSFLRYKYRNSV